jgi:hypothetical protein
VTPWRGSPRLPRPQNQGPTQGSTVSNTSLYEAAQGLGGIDPATGEGKIGTISISDNPLNTPRKQLAGQAGVENPYSQYDFPDVNPYGEGGTADAATNVAGLPPPGGIASEDIDPSINPDTGMPTGPGAETSETDMPDEENGGGLSEWAKKNEYWLAPAADLAGGALAAWGTFEGYEDYAAALTAQGVKQDKLSRDLLATGLEYANEITDIGLGLGEPFRVGGVWALAGMADMLGLDRTEMAEFMGLPEEAKFEATDRVSPSGKRQFGWKAGEYGFQTPRGQFTAAPEKQPVGAGGETLYQPEYDYDRQRIDKATAGFYGADEFDWKEPLREAGFSFEQGGTAGFMSIFSNLATLAGFGPQQAPNAAAGASSINTGGLGTLAAANYISGAGSALAQGKTGAYNALATGVSSGLGSGSRWLWGDNNAG